MLPSIMSLLLHVQTPSPVTKVTLNCDPRTSASPAFRATYALPKLEDLQPAHSIPLAHSLENIGGMPPNRPNLELAPSRPRFGLPSHYAILVFRQTIHGAA